MVAGFACAEDAAHRGEGEVIAVELAKDVDLMREALGALQEIDEAMVPTTLGTNRLSMLWRKARATIAKLEERLLRE